MSDWSAGSSKGVQNTSNNYKKLIKSFNRSVSDFKNKVDDAIDDLAIEIFKKKTNCLLCTIFIVLTARNSCCSKCFIGWMNEHDVDIIKCRMCARLIKTVLNSDELDFFCELVDLDEKKRAGGHFGYPVLDAKAMDQLFEGLEDDSETNID